MVKDLKGFTLVTKGMDRVAVILYVFSDSEFLVTLSVQEQDPITDLHTMIP